MTHAMPPTERKSTLSRPFEPGLLTALRFGKDPLWGPGRYFARFGNTFRSHVLGAPVIMTRDPGWMHEVLVQQASAFHKDKTTKQLSAFLGQGLLTNDGNEWRERRRILQPHFHPGAGDRTFEMFAEEAETEAQRWAGKSVVEMHEAMTRLTMRIALRVLFGANPDDFSSFEDIMAAAMTYFQGVGGTQQPLPTWVPTPTNRSFLRAREELRARFSEIVASARRAGGSGTLLNQLLAAKESASLSDQQVVDEAITMLVAGHETSALALCYTLHLLAMHPLSQRRLFEEVKERGIPSGFQDVQREGALRNTLTESLRLYPVTWAVGREAVEQVMVQGQPVARGTQVYIHQWQAHRHPDYFPDPERFFPERWTQEFTRALPKSLYSPFGAGPRVCIAHHFALSELATVLAVLIRRFEFTRHTTAPLRFRPSITARPRDGVLLRPRARPQSA